MKYEQKSFSVGSTKAYREGWERVFAGVSRKQPPAKCGNEFEEHKCGRALGHKGAHECFHCDYLAQWINGAYL